MPVWITTVGHWIVKATPYLVKWLPAIVRFLSSKKRMEELKDDTSLSGSYRDNPSSDSKQ